jgi:hypothetical protein
MTSLSKYIADYFGIKMGSPEFIQTYGDSLKYLTKTITASELHKRLKKISTRSIKVYHLHIVNEGYYLLNVKMWLIHSYANARNSKWDGDVELKAMDIMKRDRMYLPMFTQDSELRAQVKNIMAQLGVRSEIPTIAQLKALLVRVMAMAEVKLKPLINNLLWTKLKFLIECGSLDIESARGDFKAKIIQTFYQQAPYRKESILHWVMSMIKPIKNHAINLIKFYTTKKRVRMIEEDGVYKVVEVSMDTLEEDKLGDLGAVSLDIETKIMANQVYVRYGITQKRIKAFKLLSGTYDEGFTQWLRDEKHINANSNFDNTDFQEQVKNKVYLRLVSAYVGVKWFHFKKLLGHIKRKLSEEGGCEDEYCKITAAYA